MTMRYRITVRGDGVELRGHLPFDHVKLSEFAEAMRPFGMVLASPEDEEQNHTKEES